MTRAPALFLGHGSPRDALHETAATRGWIDAAARSPCPRAILCISAHWECKGVLVTRNPVQRTIHDFYRMPDELYAIEYTPPGDPALAYRIEALLEPFRARADLDSWGLDHGAWSVLRFLYPEADVPTLQLSLDVRRTPAEHHAIARHLRTLRDEGVMIVGSGNIVHNLRDVIRTDDAPVRDYAQRFGDAIRGAIAQDRPADVLDWRALGPDGARAQPSDEHLQPLFYTLGARLPGDRARFACDFVQYSSIDMTSVVLEAA